MRPDRAASLFLLFVTLTLPAFAQTGVTVAVTDIVDDRISAELLSGSLQLQVKLDGAAVKNATAARLIVKEARDDRGTNLAEGWKAPDFRDRDINSGALEISLASPPRAAISVRVKGNVELFVPSKDPDAVVTIPKALSKLNTPLSSPALTTAGIKITPLSHERYAEESKKHKITDKEVEEIRAQGKAHGAKEKEIELAIGLAKAMEQMDAQPVAESAVILSGSAKDFARIHSIDILGADKQPLHITSRTTTTKGDSAVMVLEPESVPPGASLRLTLLTTKSRVTVPFELKKVDLP
jgi:hypothetical protein